uniref:A-kinase anchor protein 1, mitochondrial-like n=1 Tax=Styela clava TaxID=7725 RepID=UPI00193A826E|nr:A-kinase anchor protein 1, mitochondrial-like [Styela clava]
MKPVQPTHLALAASVPVALVLIWWVYKRKSGRIIDSGVKTNFQSSEESSNESHSILEAETLQSVGDQFDTIVPVESADIYSSQNRSQSTEMKLSPDDEIHSCSLGDHYLDIESRIVEPQKKINYSKDENNPNPENQLSGENILTNSTDDFKYNQPASIKENISDVCNGQANKEEPLPQIANTASSMQIEHTESKLYTETNLLENHSRESDCTKPSPIQSDESQSAEINYAHSDSLLTPSDESQIPVVSEKFENTNETKYEHEMSTIIDSLELSRESLTIQENDCTDDIESQYIPVLESTEETNDTTVSEEHISDRKNGVSDIRNGSYSPDSLTSEESSVKTENSIVSNQSSQRVLNCTGSGEESDVSNKNNNNNCDRDGKSVTEKMDTTVFDSVNGNKDDDVTEESTQSDAQDDSSKVNGESSPNHSNGFNENNSSMHNGPPTEYENKDEAQIYLEFPSEKVGLLIGKMGRNIKQLKQDSGAEIMVHTVPFREDIQVLQITGSHSAVDIAATKIGRKFREVPLTEFDPAGCMGFGSQGSMMSSPGVMSPIDSPMSPTFAYPVPEMTQLRIPEGIPVEVVVSAIADCDCIFVQQYTHPTFHALASLEHAMSLCYSSPQTPALLSPVQVGLVCVAEHQDVWYRAQVIHANEDSSEITIKFVDYGGYSTVPTSIVKQIRADFITLPFQAAECYLDNIAPLEDEKGYSIESTTVLQELLKEGEFHARISRYRPDGVPYIRLFKRHSNVTALVNELLVNEKVARWVDDETDCMAGVVATS